MSRCQVMMIDFLLNFSINHQVLPIKWYWHTCNLCTLGIHFECINMINWKISFNLIHTNKTTILWSNNKSFLMCSKAWNLCLTSIILFFFRTTIKVTIFASILLNSWFEVSDWVFSWERYINVVFYGSILHYKEVILRWNSHKYRLLDENALNKIIFSLILNRYDLILHFFELLIGGIIHLQIAFSAS